ncbi:MAG: GNAT family N-acetyltransferase [Roseovarius sp.]
MTGLEIEGFRIAPAEAADAARLATLRVAAMRPSLEAVGRFDPKRAHDRFLDGFDAGDTWLVLEDEALAGFFVVRRREDHVYLDHIYFSESYQRRGLGRRIVEGLKAEARAAGLPVRLMALNGSPANGFYLSCGFGVVSSDALDTVYEWRVGEVGGV